MNNVVFLGRVTFGVAHLSVAHLMAGVYDPPPTARATAVIGAIFCGQERDTMLSLEQIL